jgi:hypothetical protein
MIADQGEKRLKEALPSLAIPQISLIGFPTKVSLQASNSLQNEY